MGARHRTRPTGIFIKSDLVGSCSRCTNTYVLCYINVFDVFDVQYIIQYFPYFS